LTGRADVGPTVVVLVVVFLDVLADEAVCYEHARETAASVPRAVK